MRMLCTDMATGRFIKTKKVLKWSRCDAVVHGMYAWSSLPSAACSRGMESPVAPEIIFQSQVETFQKAHYPRYRCQ